MAGDHFPAGSPGAIEEGDRLIDVRTDRSDNLNVREQGHYVSAKTDGVLGCVDYHRLMARCMASVEHDTDAGEELGVTRESTTGPLAPPRFR